MSKRKITDKLPEIHSRECKSSHISKHGLGIPKDNSRKAKELYMELITVHFPPTILKEINSLIKKGLVANRSEFIRQCVLNQIVFFNQYNFEVKLK